MALTIGAWNLARGLSSPGKASAILESINRAAPDVLFLSEAFDKRGEPRPSGVTYKTWVIRWYRPSTKMQSHTPVSANMPRCSLPVMWRLNIVGSFGLAREMGLTSSFMMKEKMCESSVSTMMIATSQSEWLWPGTRRCSRRPQ